MLRVNPEASYYDLAPDGVDVSPLAAALPPEDVKIHNMRLFVDTLGDVGETLEDAGLPPGFNRVYHYLSEEVLLSMTRDEAGDEYLERLREKHRFDQENYPQFQYPEEVERTAGIFGEYYFSQLRLYAQAQKTQNPALLKQMTGPWQQALLDPRMKDALPGLQFLAGMFTHITARDLAASLTESGVTEKYYKDYTEVVNWLIYKTTNDLAPELVPGHAVLRAGVKRPVVGLIALMREVSWRNSGEIRDADPDERERKLLVLDGTAERYNSIVLKVGGFAMKAAALTERLPDVPPAVSELGAKVYEFAKAKGSKLWRSKRELRRAA